MCKSDLHSDPVFTTLYCCVNVFVVLACESICVHWCCGHVWRKLLCYFAHCQGQPRVRSYNRKMFPHFNNCMSIGIPLNLCWILFSSFFFAHFLWYCRWLWRLHYQQYHVSRVLCHITASFSIQSPFHHPVCSQSSSRSWWRAHPFICAASHVIRRDCCSACIAT